MKVVEFSKITMLNVQVQKKGEGREINVYYQKVTWSAGATR